jgi:hypothetical protein
MSPISTAPLLRQLHEFVAALDRRVRQTGRLSEPTIARDAAALRCEASARIAELERQA